MIFIVRVGVCMQRPPKVDRNVFVTVEAETSTAARLTATLMAPCIAQGMEMPIDSEVINA